MLAHQPTQAAAQGETADTCRRDESSGGRQSEGLKIMVKLGPGEARFGADCACRQVDPHALHLG